MIVRPSTVHVMLPGLLFRLASRFFPRWGITNPTPSTLYPPLFYFVQAGRKITSAGRFYFGTDAKAVRLPRGVEAPAVARHGTAGTSTLRRHCVKAATRTTCPDGWERYDGTGAARNFLDNIGRSGRATGANADAYVSGGATRIHAVGACPSRSSPLPLWLLHPPLDFVLSLSYSQRFLSLACSPIISLWP